MVPKKPVAWHSSMNTMALYLSANEQISLKQRTDVSETTNRSHWNNEQISLKQRTDLTETTNRSHWNNEQISLKQRTHLTETRNKWKEIAKWVRCDVTDMCVVASRACAYRSGATFPSMLKTPSVTMRRMRFDVVAFSFSSRSTATGKQNFNSERKNGYCRWRCLLLIAPQPAVLDQAIL